jgi:hypothetical protein
MATYFLQNGTIYTTNNGFDCAKVPFIPLREFLVDVWNGFAVIDPKNCQNRFQAHLMDMLNKEIYMLPHNLRVVACDVVKKMIEDLKADHKKALDKNGKHYVKLIAPNELGEEEAPKEKPKPKEEEPPKEKPKPKEVREREQTRMANKALAEKKKAKAEYERQCEIANENRIARMKRDAERKKQQKQKQKPK